MELPTAVKTRGKGCRRIASKRMWQEILRDKLRLRAQRGLSQSWQKCAVAARERLGYTDYADAWERSVK